MVTITAHQLRQELKGVVKNNTGIRINNSTNESGEETSNDGTLSVENKQFNKISGESIICTDGTRATILQPMPCMAWHTIKAADSDGVVNLENTLSVTVLNVSDKHYVLGYPSSTCGTSSELEFLIDMGETEILLSDNFCSIKSKNIIKDGLKI